ncbi:hypothetical protein [Nonomuraea ferruginea]|uniref:Transposase/invertase (TIGR01784 family) n=1 Tax=Nonomuraea ferruginea TaxID=46174 RepID=A0ABT4SUQ4_9ACTN|nr:hypothetical protein [Nonomuraea ferruginea]MDA0640997.1 hypothetical protein [Nonomuraea ferruginea]
MPSAPHEALHRIFQEEPSLFSRTLKALDIPFPEVSSLSVVNTDLTEILPIERRVDTLLQVKSELGEHLVIIESQGKRDPEKPPAWAYYISYLHAKFRREVVLIVICQHASTARWARGPKSIGLPGMPTMTMWPIALGPDNVPAVVDPAVAAEDVVLAVFSALAHALSRSVNAILEALAPALDTLDVDDAGFLAEFIEVGLGDTTARQLWRKMMSTGTYRYQSEFAQQLREEGQVRGETRSILLLLERRGVAVDEAARARIEGCAEVARLDTWLVRAMSVATVDELFD